VASFPHFNGTAVPFIAYVCIRKSTEKQCGPGLHYSVDLRIETYTEPVPLNAGKTCRHELCPRIYGYFLRCTRLINRLVFIRSESRREYT